MVIIYRNLIKLYADRKYTGRSIELNNVSNSVIRELKILGETSEVGSGTRSFDNPYSLVHCNEPVVAINDEAVNISYVLRSVGNAKDSYNVLSGEYSQAVCYMELDGSESWEYKDENEDNICFSYRTNKDSDYSCDTICNCLVYRGAIGGYAAVLNNGVGLYKWLSGGNQYNYFVVPKSVAGSLDEWKNYLSEHNVVFMYAKASPDVTVGTPAEAVAGVPNTEIALNEDNDLGSVELVVQTKE